MLLGEAEDVLVDQQRLLAVEHELPEGRHLDRFVAEPLAPLEHVREVEEARGLVVHGDVDDLGVEDLLDLGADDVVDPLRLELAGDRGLDAVDQRELGVPLPGLVDETCVLERHAEAPGERDEEPLVGVGERVLAVDVLERDDAGGSPACEQGHEEPRLRHLAGQHRRVADRSASAIQSSLIASGSRVSRTCLRNPKTGMGSISSRSPRSIR